MAIIRKHFLTPLIAFILLLLSSTSTWAQEICDDPPNCSSINTALGTISSTPTGFVNSIITIAIGLAGGSALLIILFGFFTLATSAGIPDKVKAGNELITSAVTGLIFILLSVVFMNLIGIQVLGLPGLTATTP